MGARRAEERGIIIADTKFEFGLVDGAPTLVDEAMTPDSSRFWPMDQYHPGISPPSLDKQFVRDYLEQLDWDKKTTCSLVAGRDYPQNLGKLSGNLSDSYGFGIEDELECANASNHIADNERQLTPEIKPRLLIRQAFIHRNHRHPEAPHVRQIDCLPLIVAQAHENRLCTTSANL